MRGSSGRWAGPIGRRARLVSLSVAVAVLVSACTSAVAGEASKAAGAPSSQVSVGDGPQSSERTSTTGTASLPAPTSAAAAPRPPALGSARQSADARVPVPSAVPPTPAAVHDREFGGLAGALAAELTKGDRSGFVGHFAPNLRTRVGKWFDNTRGLGVAAATFAPMDDYSSDATDGPNSFTRSLVLGVRTPYDAAESSPGIVYAVAVAVSGITGHHQLLITTWQPRYMGDPMNCNCRLTAARAGATAVVYRADDNDLAKWSKPALDAAAGGITWSHLQMAGSGLIVPKGQVVFLADAPYDWFLPMSRPKQDNNVTVALIDAHGPYPGENYSRESRIVLMLQAANGQIVADGALGKQYASDVLTHESTHQLMSNNSSQPGRTTPPAWVAEGIAVAVETLYRDSLDDSDQGYPAPDDLKNVDTEWLAEHLTKPLPTREQLYAGTLTESNYYYALAGSVFRFLSKKYSYVTMMKVAKSMYQQPQRTPFAFVPDPGKPDHYLPAAGVQSAWRAWVTDNYLG